MSDYSDFHIVDGYSIPFQLEVNSGGKKDQTLKIEECKINAGIDPKYFEKPAPPTQGSRNAAGHAQSLIPSPRLSAGRRCWARARPRSEPGSTGSRSWR